MHLKILKIFMIAYCLGTKYVKSNADNKCSVGPETSRPEVEKLEVSFPREKVFIPRSDSLN